MSRRGFELRFHDSTCSGKFPHPPEHKSIHKTLRAAVAAVPSGATGYINFNPRLDRLHYCVSPDGTVATYGRATRAAKSRAALAQEPTR